MTNPSIFRQNTPVALPRALIDARRTARSALPRERFRSLALREHPRHRSNFVGDGAKADSDHRISLRPSPLKSPTTAKFQGEASVTRSVDEAIDVPPAAISEATVLPFVACARVADFE